MNPRDIAAVAELDRIGAIFDRLASTIQAAKEFDRVAQTVRAAHRAMREGRFTRLAPEDPRAVAARPLFEAAAARRRDELKPLPSEEARLRALAPPPRAWRISPALARLLTPDPRLDAVLHPKD